MTPFCSIYLPPLLIIFLRSFLHKNIISKGGRQILQNGVIINLMVINGEGNFFVELLSRSYFLSSATFESNWIIYKILQEQNETKNVIWACYD